MTIRSVLVVLLVLAVAQDGVASEAHERLDAAAVVLDEILSAPDGGIPEWVLERAHCAVIVPAAKHGAFLVGAKYGKGVAVCRKQGGGWTAPSTVRMEGGSFGLQLGGGETDAILLVMNEQGKNKLVKSRFTIGAKAGAMAGPVGRSTKAATDALMHAKILSYSRARGVFAGVAFEGGTLRPDSDDNQALYGKSATHAMVLNGQVSPPAEAQRLLAALGRYSWAEK
jgi:lipid-binding SYLF domain-containing protein